MILSATSSITDDDESSSSSERESDLTQDPNFKPDSPLKKIRENTPKKRREKALQYSKLAAACDRTGVSDRAAAIISTSVLHDQKCSSHIDFSLVLDRSKVRRSRIRHRSDLQEKEHNDDNNIVGLSFDGRKDQTLIRKQIGDKFSKSVVQEEHISHIQEPDSKYFGHFAVKTGSAKMITDSLVTFFSENELTMNNITAIGSDGTSVNTGSKGGVIRLIELKLNKPVHWFICQLHANELPLRHLLQTLDGKTTGPRGFTGEIGKNLEDCLMLGIVDFEPIPSNLPDINQSNLSTDQKYLYNIHKCISRGEVPDDMVHRNPGKLAHSRWLTTANRVLRLYVSTAEPTDLLKTVVEYIMKVYAPVWFQIKVSSSSENGAHHVFNTIDLTRKLNNDVKDIVFPVTQRNAFYAHPENLLFCMINDKSSVIRELGWRRIKKARELNKGKTVRMFHVPKLNFEATSYTDLISWQTVHITEPPITRHVDDKELDILIQSKEKKQFPSFPCHTQAVERCVKLVTEASFSVCGQKSRDGFIRSRIESRKKMPTFETKRQFSS